MWESRFLVRLVLGGDGCVQFPAVAEKSVFLDVGAGERLDCLATVRVGFGELAEGFYKCSVDASVAVPVPTDTTRKQEVGALEEEVADEVKPLCPLLHFLDAEQWVRAIVEQVFGCGIRFPQGDGDHCCEIVRRNPGPFRKRPVGIDTSHETVNGPEDTLVPI